jgi:hypothetical protein
VPDTGLLDGFNPWRAPGIWIEPSMMKVDFSSYAPFALAFVLAAATLFVHVAGGAATVPLWQESGWFENISALGHFLGLCSFSYAAWISNGYSRLALCFWAALCLIFFGEETSWLQHQIGYATPPEVAQHNIQGEFNFHNLEFLLGPSGLWTQILFFIGFTFYFLVMPVALKLVSSLGRVAASFLPIPGARLIVFIWAPILVSIAGTLLASDAITRRAIGETREMLFGISIGVFGLLTARTVSRAR